MSTNPTMRAKFRVSSVSTHSDTCETVGFTAVSKEGGYPDDGTDEDNTFSRWTPSASCQMTITNPDLVGKFAIGDKFYVDFTKAEA